MRYSIEPRDRIYVKGYGFFYFAKNMGNNLSNKYDQKRLDSAKNFTTDAIKTVSKRAIQKTADNDASNEIETQKENMYLQKKDTKLLMN